VTAFSLTSCDEVPTGSYNLGGVAERGSPVRLSLVWESAVKLIRNGLVVVAVAASMVLPATAAHAAPPPPLKVTSFTGNGSQGWTVDTDTSTTYDFVDTQKKIGSGSVRFGPISNNANDKFAIRRGQTIPSGDLQSISFDYFIDPASPNANDPATPHRFYLNLYTDSTTNDGVPGFYECRYDYESVATGTGWHTTTITPSTPAVLVRTNPNPPGLVCPTATSFGQLPPGSQVLSYALNGGDTSASDAGLIGYFDNFVVTTSTQTTTFDFEPAPVTPPAPVKACSQSLPLIDGTARNDIKNGTGVAQKIDLKAGNDISDAKGGADCVLGGDGNDQLTGGAGDDEIRAGGGNDIVFVKNDGVDTVDCGGGNDIVFADKTDTVSSNCETVLGRS
jgi:Ca2+-binding RTX toxin-like protein